MMSGAQIVSHQENKPAEAAFCRGSVVCHDLYLTGQGKSKLNGSYMSMFAAEGKESEGSHVTDRVALVSILEAVGLVERFTLGKRKDVCFRKTGRKEVSMGMSPAIW